MLASNIDFGFYNLDSSENSYKYYMMKKPKSNSENHRKKNIFPFIFNQIENKE